MRPEQQETNFSSIIQKEMNQELIQPRSIRLDASTVCQLKCRSCPTASGITQQRLGSGFLKLEDFQELVDKNRWVSHIELANWGEMFLNKDLIPILKYAYKKNVTLSALAGVNLNSVNEDVLEALVKYKFARLACSIDGVTQETYSLYRVGGNFQRVIENIKKIADFKKQFHSRYPHMIWQFVAFGHNEQEISKARKMAKSLQMSFYVKLSWEDLYTNSFSSVKNKELLRKETEFRAATREEYRQKYGKEYMLRNCCLEMWRSPQINYDGRVLGCSANQKTVFGNAFQEGLIESINSEKLDYTRKLLMGKKPARDDIPCIQCRSYATMKENNDWIKEEETKDIHTQSRILTMLENKVIGYKLTRLIVRLPRFLESFSTQKNRRFLHNNVYSLKIPLPNSQEDWKPCPLFRGETHSLKDISCHASTLKHGVFPHPPHEHEEEELLLLLSGDVNLILRDESNAQANRTVSLKPGQFVYYPADFAHTLQTTSEKPANYLMFKWKDVSKKKKAGLSYGKFEMFDSRDTSQMDENFSTRLVFEGPTKFLKKLQCHTSILKPHTGYAAHKDPYDVAIIVLAGELETIGESMGPHTVIFYARGEAHGLHNPGDKVAKYIVFEFHGSKNIIRRRLRELFKKMTDADRLA